MKKEMLFPFFVYDKNKREAYFIVINPNKGFEGINNVRKRPSLQKSAVEWPSRLTLGA